MEEVSPSGVVNPLPFFTIKKYNSTMKTILLYTILSLSLLSNLQAHIKYDPSAAIELQQELLDFWTAKAEASPLSHDLQIKLANVNTALFQLTGQGEYLLQAEDHLQFTTDVQSLSRSTGLCLLAQNLITQHKFCEAYDVILEAAVIKRNIESINLIKYDIEYELGYETTSTLSAIEDKTQMDYMIRQAKQHKKNGKYNLALLLLETCKDKAEQLKKEQLMYWLESNIAEVYMDSGDTKQAKKSLKSLTKNYPNEWYGYKLLARVEYETGNRRRALDIITHVLEYHSSPELSILKNRIQKEISGDADGIVLDQNIHDLMHDPENGSMYATHAAKELLRGDDEDLKLALEITIHEVQHRATPETLALLAYAYHRNGYSDRAYEIATVDLDGKALKKSSQRYVDEILKR
jgi:hypothetical protein